MANVGMEILEEQGEKKGQKAEKKGGTGGIVRHRSEDIRTPVFFSALSFPFLFRG